MKLGFYVLFGGLLSCVTHARPGVKPPPLSAYFAPFGCKCEEDAGVQVEVLDTTDISSTILTPNRCDFRECVAPPDDTCTRCIPEVRIWPSGEIGQGDWLTFARPFHVCETSSSFTDETGVCALDDESFCSPNDVLDTFSSFNFVCDYIDGELALITQRFMSSDCSGQGVLNTATSGPQSAIVNGAIRNLVLPGQPGGPILGMVEIASCCGGPESKSSKPQCRIQHDSAVISRDAENYETECDINFRRRGPSEGVCECQFDRASNTFTSRKFSCEDGAESVLTEYTYRAPPPPKPASCQERFGSACLFCSNRRGCTACRAFYKSVLDPRSGLKVCRRDVMPSEAEVRYINSKCKTNNCKRDPPKVFENCANVKSWGCRKCKAGFFRKNNDFPCVSCDIIPGCDKCSVQRSGYGGCEKCQRGFEKRWDQLLGYTRCLPKDTELPPLPPPRNDDDLPEPPPLPPRGGNEAEELPEPQN